MRRFLLIFILLLVLGCHKGIPPQREDFFSPPPPPAPPVEMVDSMIVIKPDATYYDTDGDGVVDNSNIHEIIHHTKVDKQIVYVKNTELSVGRIVYSIPDTMRLQQVSTIKIRIAKNQSSTIYNSIGKVTGESEVRTSSTMEVNLIDPEGNAFSIVKSNSNEQIIEDSGYTEWIYNVTPLKTGKHSLDLVVSIIKDKNKKEIVYSDLVYIRSNPKEVIKGFWEKNWQWGFSTILIPLLIWFYNKRKKKNEKDKGL